MAEDLLIVNNACVYLGIATPTLLGIGFPVPPKVRNLKLIGLFTYLLFVIYVLFIIS